MPRVILQMMITLDGFVAGPNDELDWIDDDPVMGEAHFTLAEGADAALIGHTVYRGMAGYWPQVVANPDAPSSEAEFGALMNRLPKIVISTTPEELAWENCEQLLVKDDADLVAKLTELKSSPGRYLLLYGGVQTARTLIKHGLVDEYRLDICPIALGAGKPLFPQRTPVKFISATPYKSGAMTVIYQAI
ncbi:MAG TPA: dihydrofolate reductase family protein [Jatrophihabitantaceae bacterium]